MRINGYYLLGFLWVLVQGCGTTLETEINPDWRSEVPVNNLGTVYAMDENDRFIIGNDNDIYVLDKQTGEVVESLDESFWQRLINQQEIVIDDGETYTLNLETGQIVHEESGSVVEDIEGTLGHQYMTEIATARSVLDGVVADAYTLLPHENSNSMLLFDYRFLVESITALDTDLGETAWQNSAYEYSLAKYSGAIDAAREVIAQAGANLTGGEAHGVSDRERRGGQIDFMHSIYYEVPDSDDFLFKTFDGLVLIDGTDGTEKWRIDEFTGPGLAGVEVLPNGDFIVLSTGRDIMELELASEYNVSRISADGEVLWISEHSGSHTTDLFVSDGHVVVDAAPTEVFDIDNGEKLWESDADYRQHRPYNILVTEDRMFVAGDLEHRTVTVGHRGWVWEYDLDTGEVLWQTEETRTTFEDVMLVDDVLLAYGEGTLFGGNGGVIAVDTETNEELWKTPEMSALGWHGFVQEGKYYGHLVTEPLIHEGTVYIAGPDNIFAIDLHSGDILFEEEHGDHGTGGTNERLVMHNDRIIVVGRDAVVAYEKDSGSLAYATETELTSSFTIHEDHIVIRDGSRRFGAFDLETGEIGPMFRSESTGSGGRFGNFSGSIYIPENGEYVYRLEGGYITRYSLF